MPDGAVTITLPKGQPNHRFMRYVRPPIRDDGDDPPLYPLCPATRPLRLGIDVATIPVPPAGTFSTFLRREELDIQLLVPQDVEVPEAWTQALRDPLVRQIGFTTVDEANRHLDSVEFWVATDGGREHPRFRAHFFPDYQQLDQQQATPDSEPLTLAQRNRAAAYAAAAAVVGIDAIVTTAPTVGRDDVTDNDIVASVTPEDAVALIGHYLRMTSNSVVQVRRGGLVGGGSWEQTESTATIENFYDLGVGARMPYFDCLHLFIARRMGGPEVVAAVNSIRVRLCRATRALDQLLAVLSNPISGKRSADVVEAAAEAFDRQLLYLAAAFDIYGRRFLLLIDPARDPKKSRLSLDAGGYVNDHLVREYPADALAEVERLHAYAGICKVLRNHIHDGILPVDQHPGRSYGSTKNIALNLEAMPELLPGASPKLTQTHYDNLGVWRADPAEVFGTQHAVADLATAAVTLMSAGTGLIEAFTELILRNKPLAASAPHAILGCVRTLPGEPEPQPDARELFYRSLFAWPDV
ncbi:hypothetical protein [Mycobacteroides abscessus]|uniref:hypothetical protein n=1 Tax=Mycobacteroides abscessus TaxID=36809 RepID=UPI001F44CCB7|nr:hypothetical protein [Mycobacteroides abscessus]